MIERTLEMLEDILAETVDASTYPDGPCLDHDTRNDVRALIAELKDVGVPCAIVPLRDIEVEATDLCILVEHGGYIPNTAEMSYSRAAKPIDGPGDVLLILPTKGDET